MSSSGLITMRKATHHQPSVKLLRVLISAASSITRAGLERLLEKQPSIHLVGVISSADRLPPAIAESDPDVVLLHLEAQSSEINWEKLIALEVPIVLLADETALVSATAALVGGVQAILLGDTTGAELAAAAHSAAAGLLTLSGDLAPISCARICSLIPARKPVTLWEAPLPPPTFLQNTSPCGSGKCSR